MLDIAYCTISHLFLSFGDGRANILLGFEWPTAGDVDISFQ